MSKIEEVHKEIRIATNSSLLAFGLLSCERLYPNYNFFSQEYNFGNSSILMKGIRFINDVLILKTIIDKKDLSILIAEIDSVTPLPENFDTILSSSALDACTALMESLSFLLDGNIQRIIDVSTFCTDTVNMYIQSRDNLSYDDISFWTKINTDPLMIREINTQKEILKTIKGEKKNHT